MGIEVERKFLITNERWREAADAGTAYRQGYLGGGDRASVRVRIEGNRANINIKSRTLSVRRQEFEYPIPLDDARILLDQLCSGPLIEKTRYRVEYAGKIWEVDVFGGDNAGLVVAEIELAHEDESFSLPPWVGEEVSDDPRYYNVNLVTHPFKDWS